MKTGLRDDASVVSPLQAALAVTCAVGDRAILLLNEAHRVLSDARVLAAPPPSDRWFEGLKEWGQVVGDDTVTWAGDRPGESVLNSAAMFLMVEAGDIEEQAGFLGPDGAGAGRLEEITAEVKAMADALLDHIENQNWQSAGARLLATVGHAGEAHHRVLNPVDVSGSATADASAPAKVASLRLTLDAAKVRASDRLQARVSELLDKASREMDNPVTGARGEELTAREAEDRARALDQQIQMDEVCNSRRHRRVPRRAKMSALISLGLIDFPIMLWLASSVLDVDWANPIGPPLAISCAISLLGTAGSAVTLLYTGRALREYKSDAGGLLWIQLPRMAVLRVIAVLLTVVLLSVVVFMGVHSAGALAGLDWFAGPLAAMVALVRSALAALVVRIEFADGSPVRDDLVFYSKIAQHHRRLQRQYEDEAMQLLNQNDLLYGDRVNRHARQIGYGPTAEPEHQPALASAGAPATQEPAHRSSAYRIKRARRRAAPPARGLVAAALAVAVAVNGGLLYMGADGSGSTAAIGSGPTVILVSGATTEPRPTLSPGTARLLADAVSAGSGSVIVTSADGAVVDSLQLTPNLATGNNNEIQRSATIDQLATVFDRVETTIGSVSTRQTELDLLAGLDAAIRNRTPGALIVISNGLSTAGALDLRQVGWNADPSDVAALLLARGQLPNLKGWSVVFSGLGEAAGEQPPLTKPARDTLVGYWTAICNSAGAVSCKVDDSDLRRRTLDPAAAAAVVPVPGVALVDDSGGSLSTTISSDVLFVAESAELSAGGLEVLRDVADRIGREIVGPSTGPDRVTVYAVGGGGSPASQQLALHRAQAVIDALVEAGVTRPIEIKQGSSSDPALDAASGQVQISF